MNRASRRVARKRPTPKRKPPQSIMRIAAPPQRPWEINTEQVAILKNAVAKGATDEELKFCLTVARRYRLDPFRQQIWFVKRKDKSAEGGERWIPIVGINGLLHVAARDHRDFGTNDEPEFGPLKEVAWRYYEKAGKIKAPEWARVQVWKKGCAHPTVATVYWDEIYPDVGAAPLVRQMPRLMLGKCALAQAVRRAYPATDGLYIREEFQQPPQFTPGGREIVYPATEQEVASLEEAVDASDASNPHLQKFQEREKEQMAKAQLLTPAPKDSLFFVWNEESKTATITGAQSLLTKHRDRLKKFWSSVANAIVVTDQQLEDLKWEFEQAGTPFSRLKANT